jgi:hypothetical protein
MTLYTSLHEGGTWGNNKPIEQRRESQQFWCQRETAWVGVVKVQAAGLLLPFQTTTQFGDLAINVCSSPLPLPPPLGVRAPSGPGPPHYPGLTITLRHAILARLLWTSDQPEAKTSTWQKTTRVTNIHAAGGIRARNPSKRAGADPRLRPRSLWDR